MCGEMNTDKRCVVCSNPVTDGGRCPVGVSFDGGHIFNLCGKPLCEFCLHGHGGEPSRTWRGVDTAREPVVVATKKAPVRAASY